jgi:hypothetical protein
MVGFDSGGLELETGACADPPYAAKRAVGNDLLAAGEIDYASTTPSTLLCTSLFKQRQTPTYVCINAADAVIVSSSICALPFFARED